MLTPTVQSTNPSQAGTSAAAKNLGQKDIFLKLLVAQMQYQDPTKPQDPTQMSAQLAQFNMVEQQTSTNSLLQKLVDAQNSVQRGTNNAASYLGHTATVASDAMTYAGSGSSSFTLKLDSASSVTKIQIVDAGGNPVRTADLGGMMAGNNTISWDGITDSGAQAPAGDYTVKVQATDTSGNTVNATVLQQGVVQSVRFNNSTPEFVVNGVPVSQSQIQEIAL